MSQNPSASGSGPRSGPEQTGPQNPNASGSGLRSGPDQTRSQNPNASGSGPYSDPEGYGPCWIFQGGVLDDGSPLPPGDLILPHGYETVEDESSTREHQVRRIVCNEAGKMVTAGYVVNTPSGPMAAMFPRPNSIFAVKRIGTPVNTVESTNDDSGNPDKVQTAAAKELPKPPSSGESS